MQYGMRSLGCPCEAPQLPSSESVHAALNGTPGGWGKVLMSTLLRAALVAPGVYIAGARGKDLVVGSLVSSATITTFVFIFYGMKRGTTQTAAGAPAALPAPTEGN